MAKRNIHTGSRLDDFLREEGIFEEVRAAALKRVMALRIAGLMEEKHVKKTTLAKRMRTSRAALDRTNELLGGGSCASRSGCSPSGL